MKKKFSQKTLRDTQLFSDRKYWLKLNKLSFAFSFTIKNYFLSVFIFGLILLIPTFSFSQKVAILTPVETDQSKEFSKNFADSLI